MPLHTADRGLWIPNFEISWRVEALFQYIFKCAAITIIKYNEHQPADIPVFMDRTDWHATDRLGLQVWAMNSAHDLTTAQCTTINTTAAQY